MTFNWVIKVLINYIILNLIFDWLSMGHGVLYNLGVGISVVFGLGIRLVMYYSKGTLTKKKAIVHSILSVMLCYFSYFVYEKNFTHFPIQIYLGIVSFMSLYMVEVLEKVLIIGIPTYLNLAFQTILAKKDKGGIEE